MDMDIEKLSPEIFIYELYEPNWCRLGMSYNLFPWNGDGKDELVSALKRFAIGYCDSSRLYVRPRTDSFAVMCEDEDGKFWFHVDKDVLERFLKDGDGQEKIEQ